MHPLLVSAVANTAQNFLERWAGRPKAPAPTPAMPDASFQEVLDGKHTPAWQAAAKSPAELALARLEKLRTDFLDAPEIRAALGTADPTKPATLSLTADGRALSTTPGRNPQPILLSPETAEIARELASLTAPRDGFSSSTQLQPALQAHFARPGNLDLIPQTSVTTLR